MDNISMERLLEENKRRSVPGLHPGLNDLIRVLGKQAHCVSRTMILCEPHVPAKVKTNYHKHCSSKRNDFSDTVVRPSALWTPVRPDQYYYDCFRYSQYPERETEYQDIENKYAALKDKPLRYSPPVCDPNRVKRSLESPATRHKKRNEFWSTPPSHTLEVDSSVIRPHLLTSSEEIVRNELNKLQIPSSQRSLNVQSTIKSSSSLRQNPKVPLTIQPSASQQQGLKSPSTMQPSNSHQRGPKPLSTIPSFTSQSGSHVLKPTAVGSENNSVPCEELIDIRNLIRKSDKENFERMQQLLLLMKELSAKDFCRATCDVAGERYNDTSYVKGKAGIATPSEVYVNGDSTVSVSERTNSPQPSSERLDEAGSLKSKIPKQGPEYLPDSSSASVELGAELSKGKSFTKSKSSTNISAVSSSEDTSEEDNLPDEHTGEEETSSENEGRPPESESSVSSYGKSDGDLTDPALATEIPDNTEGISSSQSNLSNKIPVSYSKDSLPNRERSEPGAVSFKDQRSNEQSKVSLKSHQTGERSKTSLKSQHSAAQISGSVMDPKDPTSTPLSQENGQENGQKNLLLTVCDSPMTVHELVEVSNIITDIVVLETVNELLKNGKYNPPSRKHDGTSVIGKPSMISEGTRESPFEVKKQGELKIPTSKNGAKERSDMKDLKSASLPSKASDREYYKGSAISPSPEVESPVKPLTSKTIKTPSGFSAIKSVEPGMTEKADVESEKSNFTQGSMKSKVSEKSKPDSIKSKLGEEPLKSKTSKGSTVESIKLNLEGEPDTEAMKSKLSRVTTNESMKSGEASKNGSMKSKTSAVSTVDSKMSKKSYTSKVESIKRMGSEEAKAGSHKSRQSEESNIESTISKSSDGSRAGQAKPSGESKTLTKLKPIAESSEPRAVSGVSREPEESRLDNRVGHRRRSSCSKHSTSRSPSTDVSIKRDGESSHTSQVKTGSTIKTHSATTRPAKERRLSGAVTKLSTIDSVCEREDSQVCVDYETDQTIIYYVRITENAFPPEKESYSAAGFMLKSAYDYTIPPRGKVNVKTDLVLELPPNSYGRIAARKCLAVNFGIDVGADVIDRDCRENVTVLLFNHSDKPFSIRKGNKVAQLICESIHQAAAKEKCDLLNST